LPVRTWCFGCFTIRGLWSLRHYLAHGAVELLKLRDDSFGEFYVALMEHSDLTLEIFLSCSRISLVRSQKIAKVISISNQPFNGSRSSYRRSFKLFIGLNGFDVV
jgi:hypothetical protein